MGSGASVGRGCAAAEKCRRLSRQDQGSGRQGIIGFNDMAIAAWPAYNLTTLHQPTADIITAAVELMLSIIERPVKKPVVRLFDCRVVVRGTLKAA